MVRALGVLGGWTILVWIAGYLWTEVFGADYASAATITGFVWLAGLVLIPMLHAVGRRIRAARRQ